MSEDETRAKVREIVDSLFPAARDVLVAMHAAGAGRDALIAAMLPMKLRGGWLFPDDAVEAVRQVDAFLAARREGADG